MCQAIVAKELEMNIPLNPHSKGNRIKGRRQAVGNNAKWPKKDNNYVPLFLIVFNSSFDK